ncbi:murein biosynthesis integral membrane protein MurJ [Nakamurella silvestris]|nr:murein biosynthesis integral membrane protein MurJ [Nakamurella silvestris]
MTNPPPRPPHPDGDGPPDRPRPQEGQPAQYVAPFVPPLSVSFDPEQTMMLPIVDAQGNPRYRNWASSLVTAEIALDKAALRAASQPGSLPEDQPGAAHQPSSRSDTATAAPRTARVPLPPGRPPRLAPPSSSPPPRTSTPPRPSTQPRPSAQPTRQQPAARPDPRRAAAGRTAAGRTTLAEDATTALPVPPVGGTLGAVEDPAADAAAGMKTAQTGGVVRAGLLLAVAAIASRLTGFLAKVVFLAVFSASMINSSYTLANTLPNIVFELLIGGVLTSVAIPLLARAQRSDADGGTAYTQRLVTLGFVGLLVATALAVLAAPLLTRLYLSSDSQVDPELTTQLSYLLLPQILFYGMAALFGAILNTKERFAAQAWAPVLNNLVLIAMAIGFVVVWSGEPATLSSAQILYIGLGTTLGIVLQAVVMLPSLRRSGFRFKWRFGWDSRMAEAGTLAGWAVIYVLVSQVGYIVTTNIASAAAASGIAIFAFASLLFQMPYGILGVSILTAIMPRMSRHAAAGQIDEVKNDMSLAGRLSSVALLPVMAGLIALPGAVGVITTHYGHSDLETGITIGVTLAAMAIGLLPLAISLVQMRVFYAMKDGRTPVLINAVMVAVRIGLMLFAANYADRHDLGFKFILPALALVTAISYIVGAVVGEIWLRTRFGPTGSRRVLRTIGKMGTASAIGGLAAWAVVMVGWGGFPDSLLEAALQCVAAGAVGLVVILVAALLLKVEELTPLVARFRRSAGGGAVPAVAVAGAAGVGSAAGTAAAPARPARSTAPVNPPATGTVDPTITIRRQVPVSGDNGGDSPTAQLPPVPGTGGPAGPTPPPFPAGPSAAGVSPSGTGVSAAATTNGIDAPTTAFTGGAHTAGPGTTNAPDPSGQLSPGAVVGGRYRLVNLVAVDSMGNRFWRAKDTVLPRDMAVTLLPDSPTVAATVARSLRAGRLNHIGLPQTLDLGTERGQSYIVGQWVEGATLTDLLVSGPLEGEIASSITSKVAEAVAEAHRNGISLGAIHPSLVRVNFEGQVRLSHVVAQASATSDQDIRAIGALLYLMLTGTWPLPQHAVSQVGTSPTLRPAPASGGHAVPALEVRPQAPPALAALADRALHPESSQGVRSAAAIAALLRDPVVNPARAVSAGASVDTASPTETIGLPESDGAEKKLLRERRIKLAIAAAMILVLAGLIAIVLASFSKQLVGTLEEPEADNALITAAPTLEPTSGGSAINTAPTTPGSSAGTDPASNPASTSGGSTAPPASAPVRIISGTVYDPEGDGEKDYTDYVDLAFDGDQGTKWITYWYKRQFPSLKTGVGLTLELEKEIVPTSITVASTTPGTRVEIRTATSADPATLADTIPIATADLGAQPVEIALPNAPKSKYITVFVTQLGQADSNGVSGFQSNLTEISVKGY